MKIGVLALQGDFREHREMLTSLGAEVTEVRLPAHLDGINGIVLPGGESTAISKLLATSGLFDALRDQVENDNLAVLGTCAGVILSASEVLDGIQDQRSFSIFDARVRRNGIGPQRFSSETSIAVDGLDDPFTAVFIRPPVIESVGAEVEVIARMNGNPVLCKQGRHLFATFHPELTEDTRIHRLFLHSLFLEGLQS